MSYSSSTTADENEIFLDSTYSYNEEKTLGEGGFGKLYLGENLLTHQAVAVKMEQASPKSHLQIEYEILSILKGGTGIPIVYQLFKSKEKNYLVMELLGRSIDQIFTLCKKNFSLKTITQIALQMIDRIEYIHLKGFIHRDIKPGNFIIGRGKNKDIIYMIDYGLSKRYKDEKNDTHIAYREGKGLTGTTRYASLFTHFGIEQSRRDDIEGMGYNLLFLLKGKLPWQGIRAKNKKDKSRKVMEKKKEITLEELCQGVPKEFLLLLQYARGLDFEERPDYKSIRVMFEHLMNVNNYVNDNHFDWSDEDLDKLEFIMKEMKKNRRKK